MRKNEKGRPKLLNIDAPLCSGTRETKPKKRYFVPTPFFDRPTI